jgi:hypothetical protein
MNNTVKRKIDPNSPVYIPVVINAVGLVIGAILWIYNLPETPLPTTNLLRKNT